MPQVNGRGAFSQDSDQFRWLFEKISISGAQKFEHVTDATMSTSSGGGSPLEDAVSLTRERDLLTAKLHEMSLENRSLKDQFNQALTVSDRVERIVEENSRLSLALSESESSKEDLERRLRLSLETISDLKIRIATEPMKRVERQCNEVQTDKLIKTHKVREISQLKSRVTELETDNQSLQAEIQRLKLEFDSAVRSASTYLNRPVNDFGEILAELKSSQDHDTLLVQIDQLKRELERAKSALRRKRSIHAIVPLPQVQLPDDRLSAELSSLSQVNQQLMAQIRDLSEQNEFLRSENLSLQTRVHTATIEAVNEKHEEVLRLMHEIGDFQSKLDSIEHSHAESEAKLQAQNLRVQRLIRKNEFLKQTLKTSEQKLEEEMETNAAVIEQWRQTSHNQDREIEELKAARAAQAIEMNDLRLRAKESEIEISRQNKLLQKNDSERQATEKVVKGQMDLINTYQDKLQESEEKEKRFRLLCDDLQTRPARTPEQICWICSGFPSELRILIDDIGTNPGFSNQVKANHILDVTARWFKSHIERTEISLAEERTNAMIAHSQLDILIQFLTRTFSACKIDFRDLLSSERARTLFGEFVTGNRSDVENLIALTKKLELDTVDTILGLKVEKIGDAPVAIRALQEQIRKLEIDKKKERSMRIKDRQILKAKEMQMNEESALQNQLLGERERRIHELQGFVGRITDERNQLKDQLEEERIKWAAERKALIRKLSTNRVEARLRPTEN
jgi:chromosome segregation ATPase